ncbi:hypothetical protein EHH62_14365 [Salmonella enterica subsp. arizonae serovar 40:z36:-]|nr:hypothetical protein [Salmonella enterica subsp. arizonae serovar 40:z36:-]
MRPLIFGSLLLMLCVNTYANNRGYLKIDGSVVSRTCAVNGSNSGDQTLTFDDIYTYKLDSSGKTTGMKDATLELNGIGCDASIYKIQFKNGATVDSTTGNLKNIALTGTAASEVQIQLLDGNSQVLDLRTDPILRCNQTGSGDAATLSCLYKYQYYATGKSTAGDVSTSIMYEVSYK